MKVPILRGVAARAPYFHGGNAAILNAVVNFYKDFPTGGLVDMLLLRQDDIHDSGVEPPMIINHAHVESPWPGMP